MSPIKQSVFASRVPMTPPGTGPSGLAALPKPRAAGLAMKKLLALAAACVLASPLSARTMAQQPDEIVLDGQPSILQSDPFSKILWSAKALPEEISLLDCPANWRGYRAFWTVSQGKLLLDRVLATACDKDPQELDLRQFFQQAERPVPASWFTGVLTIARGRQLDFVQQGYKIRYEKYTLLVVRSGEVVFRLDLDEPPQ